MKKLKVEKYEILYVILSIFLIDTQGFGVSNDTTLFFNANPIPND
ncbi:MAG: hypothetical protein ACJ70Z_07085 [Nitrososphaera sp.]